MLQAALRPKCLHQAHSAVGIDSTHKVARHAPPAMQPSSLVCADCTHCILLPPPIPSKPSTKQPQVLVALPFNIISSVCYSGVIYGMAGLHAGGPQFGRYACIISIFHLIAHQVSGPLLCEAWESASRVVAGHLTLSVFSSPSVHTVCGPACPLPAFIRRCCT